MGSVYKQPEREVDDSYHNWRVPSKWNGTQREHEGTQGEAKENQQGEKSKGKCAMYICDHIVCALE